MLVEFDFFLARLEPNPSAPMPQISCQNAFDTSLLTHGWRARRGPRLLLPHLQRMLSYLLRRSTQFKAYPTEFQVLAVVEHFRRRAQ